MRIHLISGWCLALPFAVACSAGEPLEAPQSASVQAPLTVGGCDCPSSGTCADLSYSDVPADGRYIITTFGGGADTQPMSCGGTADGTWAYVAGKARWACGTKLLIEANGKQCVAEVKDCGPNRCVEEAASNSSCVGHFPIMDASPFISQHLIGETSAGWSEGKIVTAIEIDAATPIGCPGGPIAGGGTGGAPGAGGTAGVSGVGGGAGAIGMAGASSGGAPPVGGTGGSATGGTGMGPGPRACSVDDACAGCTGCYDACRCQFGPADGCINFCLAGSAGSAGASGTGQPNAFADPLAEPRSDSGCSISASRSEASSRSGGVVFGMAALALLLPLTGRRRRRRRRDVLSA